MWHVEYTDEFGDWWGGLNESEQTDVAACVGLLECCGVNLGYPHSSSIRGGTKHTHIRELRIQHKGRPYRVLYAFDPLRNIILLIGGDKTGKDRWYEVHVPLASKLYDEHLCSLRRERLI
jgi:hypothetical protein